MSPVDSARDIQTFSRIINIKAQNTSYLEVGDETAKPRKSLLTSDDRISSPHCERNDTWHKHEVSSKLPPAASGYHGEKAGISWCMRR